jgi:hypothetical protein
MPPKLTEAKRRKALHYLDEYTKNMFKVRVYWGDLQTFSAELRQRWHDFSPMTVKKTDSEKGNLSMYYKRSHAIIIGISKYREEPELPNAINDAQAIKRILEEKYGFDNVTSVFNEDATANRLNDIFVDIIPDLDVIGPGDRLLIYYSGHGMLRTISGVGGEEIKEGYILPYDSKSKKYYSNISMGTIVDSCRKCALILPDSALYCNIISMGK